MSRTKHTITAPSGVFRERVSSPHVTPAADYGKTTYVSRRNQIKPWVVLYTLDTGKSWAVNSWHGRRDLAEKERRRLGYDGYVTAQAVIVRATLD